ncbi:alpha-ribazole transporter [Candidatus Geothermarchaeota archaeon]|nr:MAG: alpha-ribazole transporter [Candidatus Geothermarchaeota archaeon]
MSRERGIIVLARVGILSALSAVGAMIPVPSPVGSIALDSFPGFFAAIAYGPLEGALVCAVGHMASATRAGYPLGFIHVLVALLMMVVGIATAVISKKFGVIPGLIVGVLINTAGAPLAIPVFGFAILPILVPFLAIAAAFNAFLAGLVYGALRKRGILKQI